MATVRKHGYSQAEMDEAVAEARKQGADKALSDLERVIAGEEPDVITLAKIRAGKYSTEDLIRRKAEVDAALEAGDA